MSRKDIDLFRKNGEFGILKYVDKATVKVGFFKIRLIDGEPNTWYYIFRIKRTCLGKFKSFFKKDCGNDVDFIYSKEVEKPNLPCGYKVERRIPGAMVTDSKNEIVPFEQW